MLLVARVFGEFGACVEKASAVALGDGRRSIRGRDETLALLVPSPFLIFYAHRAAQDSAFAREYPARSFAIFCCTCS